MGQEPTSFSFSRRYFNWKKKPDHHHDNQDQDLTNDEESLTFDSSSHSFSSLSYDETIHYYNPKTKPKKKLSVSKFTSFFTKSKSGDLGSKLVGTLFGYRRGHVHIAFQQNPKTSPAFLIELSTPTSVLVREMASGLVRVALECDKKWDKKGMKLLEEPLWRAYCNGKKCGYALRRDCGPHEWRVLQSVGPITMGAGVFPGGADVEEDGNGGQSEGEVMYMRAKFERIVGSKDSEAFYMMNPDPDGSGGPELSVYLLRV
ncbi:unnamed protein product [Amaranthus hypochondriacus]